MKREKDFVDFVDLTTLRNTRVRGPGRRGDRPMYPRLLGRGVRRPIRSCKFATLIFGPTISLSDKLTRPSPSFIQVRTYFQRKRVLPHQHINCRADH